MLSYNIFFKKIYLTKVNLDDLILHNHSPLFSLTLTKNLEMENQHHLSLHNPSFDNPFIGKFQFHGNKLKKQCEPQFWEARQLVMSLSFVVDPNLFSHLEENKKTYIINN